MAIPQLQDSAGRLTDCIYFGDPLAENDGSGFVTSARSISTTAPLTGGGDLSADRTLAITEFAGTVPGSVPASLGGTTTFLRADGSWATSSGDIVYVADYGTTRAAIQAAVNAAPEGGIVQFAAATYTLDGTAISITKSLTLCGAGKGLSYWTYGATGSPKGSILTGVGNQTIISIVLGSGAHTTARCVNIRDIGLVIGSGGKGITVAGTSVSEPNDGTSIENVAFNGGAVGIETTLTRGLRVNNCLFAYQTSKGGNFSCGNSDDGAYWITGNQVSSDHATDNDAFYFSDTAAIFFQNNGVFGTRNGLRVTQSGSGGIGASQFSVIGNQIGVTGGSCISFGGIESGGTIQIVGNNLDNANAGATAAPVISITTSAGKAWYTIQIVGNEMRRAGAGHGLIFLERVQSVVISQNGVDGTGEAGNYFVKLDNPYATGGVDVSHNTFLNASFTAPYQGSVDSMTVMQTNVMGMDGSGYAGHTVATLPDAQFGSMMYVVDGDPGSDPLAGGGVGTMAIRIANGSTPYWKGL